MHIRKDRKYWWLFSGLLLWLSLASCRQASDLKAFTEASYSLQGVSDARLNDIDLTENFNPHKLSFRQGDSLLAAIYRNKVRFTSKLQLHVQMKDPEVARTMKVTKLKWLLLVDGRETLQGEVEKPMDLKDGLNVLLIDTNVMMADKDGMPNFEGLSNLVTLLGRRQELSKHLTFQIKPTIETPVGPIEVPKYITVAQPAAATAAR